MGGDCCKDKLEGTPFNQEDLEEFEACTNLTANEALQIYDIFNRAANPHKDFDNDDPEEEEEKSDEDPLRQMLDKEKFTSVLQFKNNPFANRIVDIFSERGDEAVTFEEFLDIFSVFSSRAAKEEKIKVAFRLYDFDDNGFIDPVDLEMVMDTMLSLAEEDDVEKLSQEERICIVQKVMTEGDPSITEEDQQKHGYQNVGQISYHEFERIMQRVPDFESKFYISF